MRLRQALPGQAWALLAGVQARTGQGSGSEGGPYTIARTTRATAVLDAGTSRPSMARMVSPACRPAWAATDAAATSGTCTRAHPPQVAAPFAAGAAQPQPQCCSRASKSRPPKSARHHVLASAQRPGRHQQAVLPLHASLSHDKRYCRRAQQEHAKCLKVAILLHAWGRKQAVLCASPARLSGSGSPRRPQWTPAKGAAC